MPSTLHIPPTATSLASNFWTHQIQNCLYVLQLNHWFCPLWPFWTTAAVQPFPLSPLFIRHTHIHSNSDAATVKLMAFGPHIWNNLTQDVRHSHSLPSFKNKLKTFLFSERFIWVLFAFAPTVCIVFVCAHLCMCVCVCHACTLLSSCVDIQTFSFLFFFLTTFIILMYMFVFNLYCSARWATGKALFFFLHFLFYYVNQLSLLTPF